MITVQAPNTKLSLFLVIAIFPPCIIRVDYCWTRIRCAAASSLNMPERMGDPEPVGHPFRGISRTEFPLRAKLEFQLPVRIIIVQLRTDAKHPVETRIQC